MLKLGGPTVLPTWQKKHLKLYPNRLEFYPKNRDGQIIKGKGVEVGGFGGRWVGLGGGGWVWREVGGFGGRWVGLEGGGWRWVGLGGGGWVWGKVGGVGGVGGGG